MIRKIILLTTLVVLPVIGGSQEAHADEYCREYTKTVSIGGQRERAYGTACYRPDGSWEIVKTQGSDYGRTVIRDVIYDDIGHNKFYKPTKVVVKKKHYTPTYKVYHTRSYHKPYFVKHAYHHHKHKKHPHKYYKYR